MSSATDVNANEAKKANGEMPQRTMRANPVALEVPVSVAGARPIASKDKRELFTEETTTVLVFKDGAVIQLSAAVTVGQLLFLTEKKSKKEVVCQVVHKRSHRPTSCFVELEFTEPEENFWGVSFPAQVDTARVPPAAEAVEAEETTEDDRSEPVAAPKSEDVAQLKDEVAALKAQLQELRGNQAPDEKEAVARRLAEAEAAARSAAETEARQKAEDETRKKAERGKTENAGTPATIGMKLPIMGAGEPAPAAPAPGMLQEAARPAKEEIDPLEDLLPKPALDFSHVPKHVDPNDPFNIYRPERQGAGKKEFVVGGAVLAVLILAGAGAWYKNKLPFLHRAPKADVAVVESNTSQPVSTPSVPSPTSAVDVAPKSGTTAPPAGNGTVEQENNFTLGATSARPAPAVAPHPVGPVVAPPVESPAERAALAEKDRMRVVAPAKTGAGKPGAEKTSKNHGKAKTSEESAPVPVAPEVSLSDQPVVSAKLVKAVQPIYPPDAMRNYITGDVRIEAEVDKRGQIGAMKILLGPKQFRQVAMDALKQYEYAPATQGGKPVASKVTVTIKFWFDP
ncbi:MAG TPA: TonB family protein [Candidatus Udaeobacter sp.]|nr:TonB family protein [Candidatus Udaeobacter sp.]